MFYSIASESHSIKKQKQRNPSFNHSSSSSSSKDGSPPLSSTNSSSPSDSDHKTPRKSIKNGTFLFLPYNFDHKAKTGRSDNLLEVAKELQRKQFIVCNGRFSILEKQYGVRINMITSKTSKQITDALENAKKGLENLKIRNQEETIRKSENLEGEWVLIRSKKLQSQTKPADMEQALDDLINRWENCLKIKKRSYDKQDDSDTPTPKRKYLSH
ncbi:unnamed protein product [Rotaria sp. Silwood2]|nr:unnamed protein product [Rotaria sp. Silwood2]CAF4438999.1 unnamed protein product [Rotaria sp. Silwood2]